MWTYQLTSGEACGQTTLAAKLVPLNCQGGRDEMGNRNISAMMHLLEICFTALSLTQYGFGKDIFENQYFSGVQSYHNSFFQQVLWIQRNVRDQYDDLWPCCFLVLLIPDLFVCEMKNAPKDQIFRSGSPLIKCVKDQRKEEDDKCEEETATPRESLAVSSERSLPVTPFIRRPPASIALWVLYCIVRIVLYCHPLY